MVADRIGRDLIPMDARLAHIRFRKDAAINALDFERAAALHNEELRLVLEMTKPDQKNILTHRIVQVTEADVTQALANSRP